MAFFLSATLRPVFLKNVRTLDAHNYSAINDVWRFAVSTDKQTGAEHQRRRAQMFQMFEHSQGEMRLYLERREVFFLKHNNPK